MGTSVDTALITFSIDGFGNGIASPTSALIRPFRVLYKEGKHVGKITFQFYNHKDKEMRVFGTFCYTRKNRLLFFPALMGRKTLWHTTDNNFRSTDSLLDHFTVEPSLKSWHVTKLIGEEKEPKKDWTKSMQLTQLEPDLYYWFGLSVQTTNVLEHAPNTVQWVFSGNEDQIKKFSDIVMDARDNAIFNILQLPEFVKREDEKTFLHFDIVNDKRKRPQSNARTKSMAPFAKPLLKEDVQPKSNFIVRNHEIKLEKFDGIIRVAVSEHNGELSEQAIISNQGL